MALFRIDSEIHRLERDVQDTNQLNRQPAFGAVMYEKLADLYFRKARITRDPLDYEFARDRGSRAIILGERAVTVAPPGHSQPGQWWALQASRLFTQYERFKDTNHLDAAIDAWNSAFLSLPENSDLRWATLLNQANCLSTRFEEADGRPEDIDEAISKARAAMDNVSPTMAATVRNDLSTMYITIYEYRADDMDLQRAFRYARASVRRTDDEDTENLPQRLMNLAYCRCLLFETGSEGGRQELQQAITDLRNAERLCRESNRALLPKVLSKLASALYLVYQNNNNLDFYNHAIRKAQEALDTAAASGDEAMHAQIVGEFSRLLHSCDEQGRSLQEIQVAILNGEYSG